MCGRLNIIDDPLSKLVSELVGVQFNAVTNSDFRPTQSLSVIGLASSSNDYSVNQSSWGIVPNWSKRLLINARSETVMQKSTFSHAFSHNRIVVPCNGWYEWVATENGQEKTLFSEVNGSPIFMAAIEYPELNQFVTLTQAPNPFYEEYHHRQPVIIDANNISRWLTDDIESAFSMSQQSPFEEFALQVEESKIHPSENYSLF